jgi:hypothetical protein
MKWLKDLIKVVLITVFTKALGLITKTSDKGKMSNDSD